MHFRFNGVSERDMDILFLEEFAVNRYFLQLFLRKIEDVDFRKGESIVHGKGNKERKVFFNDRSILRLSEYIDYRKDN